MELLARIKDYKVERIADIRSRLKDAKAIVLVDYKGINIEEVNILRNRLRNANVDYFVAKNTFIKRALNELGITELDCSLKGTTAVAVSKVDEIAPAREIFNFLKEEMADKKIPSFKLGFITNRIFIDTELDVLAKLPSRDQLLGQLLATLNGPISNFVFTLQGIISQFVYTVDGIAKKE